jgi:hypothetical protein
MKAIPKPKNPNELWRDDCKGFKFLVSSHCPEWCPEIDECGHIR